MSDQLVDRTPGVRVSWGDRTFVSFPRQGGAAGPTVGELRDGGVVPYPDEAWNSPSADDDPRAFVSVRSILVDSGEHLWVLDTGAPESRPTVFGGPKLVCVDLATDAVLRTIVFDPGTALPTSYLSDMVEDVARNAAFIVDTSGPGPTGIIVVDLDSGTAWRRLTGLPAATGINLSEDGDRLWFRPSAQTWASVAASALCDRTTEEADVVATVRDEAAQTALAATRK